METSDTSRTHLYLECSSVRREENVGKTNAHTYIYTAEIWGAALMEWVCRLNEGRDDLEGA